MQGVGFEPTETGPNDSAFQSPSRLDLKSSAVWLRSDPIPIFYLPGLAIPALKP